MEVMFTNRTVTKYLKIFSSKLIPSLISLMIVGKTCMAVYLVQLMLELENPPQARLVIVVQLFLVHLLSFIMVVQKLFVMIDRL